MARLSSMGRRVAILAAGSAVSLAAATQYIAYQLGFHPDLGVEIISLFGMAVYSPTDVFKWSYTFGEHFASVFDLAFFILAGGVLLSACAARLVVGREVDAPWESGTHGTARFATDQEIKKAQLRTGAGIVLGRDLRGRLLTDASDTHVGVFAPTRSGKGASIVVPTLLTWPGSAVVFDLKGELFDATAGARHKMSNILRLDFGSPKRSVCYNPLHEVRRSIDSIEDCGVIADMLIDPDSKEQSYWTRAGTKFGAAAILHCLNDPLIESSLFGLAKFLSQGNSGAVSIFESMAENTHPDEYVREFIAQEGSAMVKKAHGEQSGVTSSPESQLMIYRDPKIRQITRHSEFSLRDLTNWQNPVTLYVVVPPQLSIRVRPLYRIILNQILFEVTRDHESAKDRHKLLMMMDEFPQFGYLQLLEKSFSWVAGYNVRHVAIAQSLSQIEKVYGDKNEIVENLRTRVFHTPNATHTARNISEMLGKRTVRSTNNSFSGGRFSPYLGKISHAINEVGRSLMGVDEVMCLDVTRQLIFCTGMRPILCKKIQYWKDRAFKQYLSSPPDVSRNTSGYPFRTCSGISTWEQRGFTSKIELESCATAIENEVLGTSPVERSADERTALESPNDNLAAFLSTELGTISQEQLTSDLNESTLLMLTDFVPDAAEVRQL